MANNDDAKIKTAVRHAVTLVINHGHDVRLTWDESLMYLAQIRDAIQRILGEDSNSIDIARMQMEWDGKE